MGGVTLLLVLGLVLLMLSSFVAQVPSLSPSQSALEDARPRGTNHRV